MGCGVMVGAILLISCAGIEVKMMGDAFILALIAFLCCIALVFKDRTKVMNLLN
jgi:hypothetical protein